MKLTGARVALSATRAERMDLGVARGRFLDFRQAPAGAAEVDLSDCLLLPGLINAHDHLEFALFPRLGSGPYPNATAWANDIYRPGESPVREHLEVPKDVRLNRGGLKNLLSGVTTVAHHNAFSGTVFTPAFPVRVVKRYGWSHSLEFSPDVVESYRGTPRSSPFILHAAEGTDAQAAREIRRLDELGLLDSRLVVVHGVGATAEDLSRMRERRASIVWCPSSNLFTLGRTLSAEMLGSGPAVALGTDSPMTAEGDLIDEMRIARGRLAAETVYSMVTSTPAAMLRLGAGYGTIAARGIADAVAVMDDGKTPAGALAEISPEMVMVGGRIRLMSSAFARHHPRLVHARMRPIEVEGRGRWLVDADVPALHAEAAAALGPDVKLAGRCVHG
ncbi:MAG: amidohydrolase family protein [Acidobacteria bacterium]|nr:amidohydrolase family protein [Acidobacteriota bacterium]